MNQSELISQCLNGEREPYCSGCGAHSSRNGQCCFGVRHTYNDRDCNQCVLRVDCAALTHAAEPQPYPYRPAVGPRVIYPQQVMVNRPPVNQPARTMTRYENPTPIQPVAQPEQTGVIEPWYKRLARLFFHGAGEGAVEALLHWFRQTRPR